MAVGLVDSVVGTHNLPESVRALSSLSDIDYADHFTLSTDADATPEQWARAMFGDVPSVAEQLIWRGLLGLRLARGRSPDTVAGWQIGERGEDWIRLEAASWFLTGNLLVQTADGRVSLGTFLRYDRRLGHSVWPPLSAVHRRLVPGLLRDAAARIAQLTERAAFADAKAELFGGLPRRMRGDRSGEEFLRHGERIGPYLTRLRGLAFEQGSRVRCRQSAAILRERRTSHARR